MGKYQEYKNNLFTTVTNTLQHVLVWQLVVFPTLCSILHISSSVYGFLKEKSPHENSAEKFSMNLS